MINIQIQLVTITHSYSDIPIESGSPPSTTIYKPQYSQSLSLGIGSAVSTFSKTFLGNQLVVMLSISCYKGSIFTLMIVEVKA